MTTTTQVLVPSTDQLETAWWNLMQGDLGLDQDTETLEFMQTILDHVQQMVALGADIMDADGEPLDVVTSDEMAKRMAAAYAALFYGVQ
jgi:hypothetical protein